MDNRPAAAVDHLFGELEAECGPTMRLIKWRLDRVEA
jgi:hypothetical protein